MGLRCLKIRRWSGIGVIACLFVFLVLRYAAVDNPLAEVLISNPLFRNASDYLHWRSETGLPAVQNPETGSQLISTQKIVFSLFRKQNFSEEEQRSLQTWSRFRHFVDHPGGLPNAMEAIKEATSTWGNLVHEVLKKKRLEAANGTQKSREKQCPYSIRRMDVWAVNGSSFKLKIPCGLVQGSSITVIGTPTGLLGDFRIDLMGATLPGDPEPPIVLHCNVRLMGDKATDDPVIVQNSWTPANDWGPEERCPSPTPDDKKVDNLDKCSQVVGKDEMPVPTPRKASEASRAFSASSELPKRGPFFPFRQGHLAITTLRVGAEGIQMTVDGKHITSFAYRESLEPWLVSEVRISGDFKAISVLSVGLPTSEDLEHVADFKILRSPPLPLRKPLSLFIGVVSTANNFKRRMAVRRSWMQFDAVKSGRVAVRFFVGLHKNQMVNEELWSEARAYGDVQLMPFVDYYSLITWKSIAICIFGTEVVAAKFVMKADDDSFVRVDEILSSLHQGNVTRGLLFGSVDSDSRPQRSADSKWYITHEEWPEEKYPPWAHGPGYVVSKDVAEYVHRGHRSGQLKMFKLEDVAMGIWVSEMQKEGAAIRYVNDDRIYSGGCEPDYIVAHYQGPRDMLCLWQRLQETRLPTCCGER
ncbi:unnamed protein product [Spirodela intermedia]|uniref:Galectin domain-containing protein n=1 Tax=Spirodela intermedia TaxID=51605 RepID=A0A7I8KX91_SPIIN|nr:unnamed protein product [Spirodela intermedia]